MFDSNLHVVWEVEADDVSVVVSVVVGTVVVSVEICVVVGSVVVTVVVSDVVALVLNAITGWKKIFFFNIDINYYIK